MMKVKPFIRKELDCWICTHSEVIGEGLGRTPKEAYEDWTVQIKKVYVFTTKAMF